MARLRYNGLSTTLGGSLTNVATSVTFAAALTHSNGTNVPTIVAPDYIPLAILGATGHLSEIVYLTAYTAGATTGTITRGQEGTTGAAHSSGDVVTGAALVADDPSAPIPANHGMIAWNTDPASLSFTEGGLTGRVLMSAVPLAGATSISKIWIATGSSVGTARTSGQCFVGLYDSAGTRLAVSADISTTVSSTFTSYGISLTGAPVAVSAPASGYIYVAILLNFTGTFNHVATNNNTASAWGNVNVTATAGARGLLLAATGLTALPSPAVLTAGTLLAPIWVGVS